jgi:hypothetical protein
MNNSTNAFEYFLCPSLLEPDINEFIHVYGPLLRGCIVLPLTVVNLIANIINIKIRSRKEFLNGSMSIYLIFLSIFSILQMYSIMVQYFLQNTEYFTSSSFMCKFHFYLQANLPLYVPWYSVLVCMDRLLTTIDPKTERVGKKKSFQLGMVIAVTIICCGVNAGHFTNKLYESLVIQGLTLCNIEVYVVTISFYSDIVVMFAMPFLFMFVFNIIMACKLWMNPNLKKDENIRRIKKCLKVTRAINISFFVFYAPACVLQILSGDAVSSKLFNDRENCVWYFIFYILNYIAYNLRYSYSTCLFFVYFRINSKYRECFESVFA